jgi:hypothetical protein
MEHAVEIDHMTFVVNSDLRITVDPSENHVYNISKETVEVLIDDIEDLISKYKDSMYFEFEDDSGDVHEIAYTNNRFWFDNKLVSDLFFVDLHDFLEDYFAYYIHRNEDYFYQE